MSEAQTGVDREVRARFGVKDSYLLPDGEFEYHVNYAPDSKGKFLELGKALDPMGLTPWLSGTREDCVLSLKRKVGLSPRRSRVPVILALLSFAMILVFSLLEQMAAQQVAPGIPGYAAFLGFGIPVFAIVGARYFAHVYAARRCGEQPNSSYLLPGLPGGITATLPTLGFISYQPGPAMNRDRYFDMMILGPLVALLLSIVLQIAGDATAVASSVHLSACGAANNSGSVCLINPSVIQIGISYVLGPFLPGAASGTQAVSPLGDGAAVGMLLVFVALLPMASFDGGHISSVLWGPGKARVTTYLSVIVLLALDTSELFYWGVAIVVLLVGGKPLKLTFADDISGVSRKRLLVYLALLFVAFLAVPIPQDIASVRLA